MTLAQIIEFRAPGRLAPTAVSIVELASAGGKAFTDAALVALRADTTHAAIGARAAA